MGFGLGIVYNNKKREGVKSFGDVVSYCGLLFLSSRSASIPCVDNGLYLCLLGTAAAAVRSDGSQLSFPCDKVLV